MAGTVGVTGLRHDARMTSEIGQVTPIASDRSLATYARIIKDLGFPIVVAAILLYMIIADVPANVSATRLEIQAVRAELAEHARASEVSVARISGEVQASNDRLARIMQQICVNTAQTNQDRAGCFP